MMTTESEPGGEWEQVAPLLEVAMSQLSASDRHAILLYYFEQRGFRAVGAALGISDDAAQKRVTRALPKLRSILLRRGATISITSLATVLTASAVSAAPPGLAYGVSTASIANALATPAGWTALSCEALQLAKVKQAISIASLVFLIGASGWLLRSAMLTGFGRFTPLNLSQHYNGDLRKSWTDIYPGNDLSALPRGRQRFHKVPFDIRGVVQLQGRQLELKGLQLPERVRDIPVNDTGRRLHLLHATSACAPATGTQLAALVLHYSDGAQAEIPIRQGVHCFDWWAWNEAPPSDPNTTVAWVGQNEAARNQGINVQLFQTAFSNPAPAKLIATIDYVSSMSCSAPFMVGLTVEH